MKGPDALSSYTMPSDLAPVDIRARASATNNVPGPRPPRHRPITSEPPPPSPSANGRKPAGRADKAYGPQERSGGDSGGHGENTTWRRAGRTELQQQPREGRGYTSHANAIKLGFVLVSEIWPGWDFRGFPAPEQVGAGQGVVGGASAMYLALTVTATAVPSAHALRGLGEGLAGQRKQKPRPSPQALPPPAPPLPMAPPPTETPPPAGPASLFASRQPGLGLCTRRWLRTVAVAEQAAQAGGAELPGPVAGDAPVSLSRRPSPPRAPAPRRPQRAWDRAAPSAGSAGRGPGAPAPPCGVASASGDPSLSGPRPHLRGGSPAPLPPLPHPGSITLEDSVHAHDTEQVVYVTHPRREEASPSPSSSLSLGLVDEVCLLGPGSPDLSGEPEGKRQGFGTSQAYIHIPALRF
ncbi:transcription initiation factor TFIID subunit 4-like [Eubalaena glacialis]|uniref:transcription initiation factor TFIID subunit 4-like n=1 Tax=Eubalaena glacialis TaxID=27606 RepID=UPI002A59D644|nr:transcription initiation factor TFIID subunit 4-like [Eubalaena glacialis]